MAFTHYQLLSNCSDEQLRTICERRRLPIPLRWEDEAEGRVRLLKTMVFHLEDHKRLSDTLADLDSSSLVALKHLAGEGTLPAPPVLEALRGLGLVLPDGKGWTVADRVADALDDFDDGALNFQAPEGVKLRAAEPFRFSLALTSVLLRCAAGLRVLKGGLPAKKELGQLMQRNAMLQEEQDATLLFTLLHRLGLLWSREGRVETLLPAVTSHPPRWVAERAFASLLEHDLKAWGMPPAEDRHFLMQHLLERRGQTLAVQPFLAFLRTLHPLDEERTRAVFLPFLGRMGIIQADGGYAHLRLTEHGEALAHEYLLRDLKATAAHWQPLEFDQPMILQPTLELLTPLLQNPHRLLQLAQLADVEALDAMGTFRVSHATLVRALDAGVPLEELGQRLGASTQTLPQPLLQLLEDLSRRVGEVEVHQGVRLVRARTAHLADELKLRPELAPLKLATLSDTVLEVRGDGNAHALLKQAGFMPKPGRFLALSVDSDEKFYLWALAALAFVDEKGMNHHLEPVQQMVRSALQKLHDEDPALYQEVQRRIPMLHLGGEDQLAEEVQRILEYAAGHTLMVELTYLPPAAHRTQLRRVSPRTIQEDHLLAFCHLHQEEMAFRLTRIQGVKLLNERGWTPANHSQAG
ncbi:helicase-associated domain-containing protein [Geothrix oryzisoli]|uniref:helicase-associated domain-containing protein n=1 Tax=Geothrix oryzisoli TaxID=2922721 RepID=UPI001FAC4F03|nr:helicase-associated domain-containing protein [Geothrix oryzisoli]